MLTDVHYMVLCPISKFPSLSRYHLGHNRVPESRSLESDRASCVLGLCTCSLSSVAWILPATCLSLARCFPFLLPRSLVPVLAPSCALVMSAHEEEASACCLSPRPPVHPPPRGQSAVADTQVWSCSSA